MGIRKISVLLISVLVLILGCCTLTHAEGYEKVYRGDMDENGRYSLRDALAILKVAARIDEMSDLADVDLNGVVDIEDAKFMMDLVVNNPGDYGMYTYAVPEKERILIVDNQAYSHDNRCFHSIKEALAYVNANPPASEAERLTLDIIPGVYREHLEVTAPYVSFKNASDGAEEVKITYFVACNFNYKDIPGRTAADTSRTIYIDKGAEAFEATDIVFENSFNIYLVEDEKEAIAVNSSNDPILARFEQNDATINQNQALAVRCAGDKAVFKNCSFLGRQDTLMLPTANKRSYFENCYIEGTVDFIYGDGTAVFKDCVLNVPYNSGYLTAASTPAEVEYGFLFYNCTMTRVAGNGKAAAADGSYSLGRPWGAHGMVVYWNCKMDAHIRSGSKRFEDMEVTADQARFFEVGSMNLDGEALDLDSITDQTRETILSQSDMAGDGQYAAWKWLWGKDSWNPAGFTVK